MRLGRRVASRANASRFAGDAERGQGLTEFALVLPIFLFLLLIMLEFGLAFNHSLTVGQATREGARTGSMLANAEMEDCAGAADPLGIDKEIIAGIQRILVSPGSDVEMKHVSQIRIFRADANGDEIASDVNIWLPAMSSNGKTPLGEDIDCGTTEDRLYFASSTVTWPVSARDNGVNPDSIGVAIRYTYHLKTALSGFTGAVMRGSQPATITMNDQTVMVLNPTN